MNKTLLITTGGTLACTPTPDGLTPTLKGTDILSFSSEEADIDVLDFKLIDSSIMTDEDRAELADLLWYNREKGRAGQIPEDEQKPEKLHCG